MLTFSLTTRGCLSRLTMISLVCSEFSTENEFSNAQAEDDHKKCNPEVNLKLIGKIPLFLLSLGFSAASAQIPYPNPIKHVVVLFQENRTPDNLFQGLLTWPGINPANYNIATSGLNSSGQTIPLTASPFANHYDLSHAHAAFVAQYDG